MAESKSLENRVIITLDDGSEKEMEILLTFKDQKSSNDYVLYYDPNEEEGSVYAFRYDEEGKLYALEGDKEWKLVEEVFNAYMSEEE